MKNTLFIFVSLWAFLSCNNHQKEENTNDDFAAGEMVLDDTLKLVEGKVPNDWVKVSLLDGYYIGFPKQPKKKEINNDPRIDFKLKRSKYSLQCTLTDLSLEPSYEKNKKYRMAYYQAIIEDLTKNTAVELINKKAFYSQAIYEGILATLDGGGVRVYLQCVIIENILYTMSFTLFDNESPIYLQLKDKFFYSFGNDFYRNQHQPIDTNNVL